MNTQQLQNHLASSLSGLAKVCESHEKAATTDALIIKVLADTRVEEEELLCHIQEVNEELHKIICVDGYESQINLNQLYTASDEEPTNRTRLWSGLCHIASGLVRESKQPNENILQFIYRALSSLDTEESSSVLKEMDIVKRICSVS